MTQASVCALKMESSSGHNPRDLVSNKSTEKTRII